MMSDQYKMMSNYLRPYDEPACRVVRRLINTNPGLKVERKFNFSCVKVFSVYLLRLSFSRGQN